MKTTRAQTEGGLLACDLNAREECSTKWLSESGRERIRMTRTSLN